MILAIHGNTNCGYTLSNDSKARADKAIELILEKIKENPREEITLYISGGLFNKSQQGITVAKAIKTYIQGVLLSKCVFIKIITESESLTTIDNVERLCKWLKNGDIVITSHYHSFRTKLIWKLIGKKHINVISSYSNEKIVELIPKLVVEVVGVIITIAYWMNIRWPELYFKAKDRTI